MGRHRADPEPGHSRWLQGISIPARNAVIAGALTLAVTAGGTALGFSLTGGPDPEPAAAATPWAAERTSHSSTVRDDAASLAGAPKQDRGPTVRTTSQTLVLEDAPQDESKDTDPRPGGVVLGAVAEDVAVATYDSHEDQTRIWFQGQHGWTETANLDLPADKPSKAAKPSQRASQHSAAPTDAQSPQRAAASRTASPGAQPTQTVENRAPVSAEVPATFTVTGSGWGHGVGMSQYGAAAMARNGYSHTQILTHYYAPASLDTRDTGRDIRVHLRSANTLTLSSTGKVRVNDADHTGTGVSLSADGTKVTATLTGASEKDATRTSRAKVAFSDTITVPGADGGSRPTSLRHGHLEITATGGQLNVVAVMGVEDYLYGLAEVPSSWPAAALQAQAVAARTYALRNMGSGAGKGWDVTDETSSQKFTGLAKEDGPMGAQWKAAVSATTGQVLTYSGAPIDAVYHSSSGGYTRSSADVWGGTVPYLTARPDPWTLHDSADNPHATWTREVSQQDMREVFGTDTAITAVRVDQAGDGALRTATATLADGSRRSVDAKTFRSGVGAKSAWVKSVTGI